MLISRHLRISSASGSEVFTKFSDNSLNDDSQLVTKWNMFAVRSSLFHFGTNCNFLQFNTLHGATPPVKRCRPDWMMMLLPFPTPIKLGLAVAVILYTTTLRTEQGIWGGLLNFAKFGKVPAYP